VLNDRYALRWIANGKWRESSSVRFPLRCLKCASAPWLRVIIFIRLERMDWLEPGGRGSAASC